MKNGGSIGAAVALDSIHAAQDDYGLRQLLRLEGGVGGGIFLCAELGVGCSLVGRWHRKG